jgi:hypothetical protein
MTCSLDLKPLIPTTKANSNVTVRLNAATATIQRASLNHTDITEDIDPTGKTVSFTVPAGINTVVLVLLPPPTGESMDLVEDCGGGQAQTIFSFGSGIHASISFFISAS